MSEVKHTPGPWRYESTSGSNYARIFLSANEEDGDNLRGYCGEANARLIAAAPELLEALQHIQRCIPLGGFAQIHHNSDTWAQIDAAIAKATGETE